MTDVKTTQIIQWLGQKAQSASGITDVLAELDRLAGKRLKTSKNTNQQELGRALYAAYTAGRLAENSHHIAPDEDLRVADLRVAKRKALVKEYDVVDDAFCNARPGSARRKILGARLTRIQRKMDQLHKNH